MIVYKHMESEWLDEFCSGKSVLIRPFSEFRKKEEYQPGIGDPLEGRVTRTINGTLSEIKFGSETHELLRSAGYNITGRARFEFSGNVFESSYPDMYIFCTSVALDAKVSDRYDAVARIIDVEAFAVALLEALKEHGVKECFHGPVEYRDDLEGDLLSERRIVPRPSPFFKRPRFAADKEYRFAFRSHEPLRSKLIVKPRFIPGLILPVDRP